VKAGTTRAPPAALPPDAARFLIPGDRLHMHMQHVRQHHAAGTRSYAVLAISLACASTPRLDYRPETDAFLVRHTLHLLRRLLRENDRVAVIGPHELIVVLSDLPSPEHAELCAARLLAAFEAPLRIGAMHDHARATVGIANGTPGLRRPGDLIRQARTAGHEALTASRNYEVYPPGDGASEGESLEPALRAAVNANEFHLVFQPQVDLATGVPVAAEVLARWERDDGRRVGPNVFIPHIERCGLMPRFTGWVVNSALRSHRQFVEAGLQATMAINVSAVDLHERDFCELVEQALQTWSVRPADLTLEITETAPMREPREVVPLLERLKDIGVGLSIDDFGTGYSSLSLLRQLPLDEIKIDQQFVRGLLESKQSLDIVRTTLSLAGNFGLRTVAEGIKDQATLIALRDMGCELGQGFGIARPADLETVVRWMREHGGQSPATQDASL
jgi:EAL domain-containing protein (putative c-di-GMP-specific phosphodiesterase class I)